MSKETTPASLRAAQEEVDHAADHMRDVVDRLGAAQEVSRVEIDLAIEGLVTAGRHVRGILVEVLEKLGASGDRPSWATPDEMRAALEELATRLERLEEKELRSRLEALILELRDARITERVDARRRRLESLRIAACASLASANETLTHLLVWPPVERDSWVRWILGLEDPEATAALDVVSTAAPELGELLSALGDPARWEYPTSGSNPARDTPVPTHASATEIADFGPHLNSDEAAEPLPSPQDQLARTAEIAPACEANAPPGSRTPNPIGAEQHIPSALSPSAQREGTGPPAPQRRDSQFNAEEQCPPVATNGERSFALHTDLATLDLPVLFDSYEEFLRKFWRDPAGNVVPAPWRDLDAPSTFVNAARQALVDGALAELIVLSRAAHELGFEDVPRPIDVKVLCDLLEDSTSSAQPADGGHVDFLRGALANNSIRQTLAFQMAIVITSLTASPSHGLSIEDGLDALARAGLATSPAGAFLEAAFQVGLSEEWPIRTLRTELRKAPLRSPDELKTALTQSLHRLKEIRRTLWNAAGGKVQRTHCREAWQSFVLGAKDVLDAVEGGTLDDIRKIDALLERHREIADTSGAKYQDRSVMDRGAKQLVEAARAVIVTRRDQSRHQKSMPPRSIQDLRDRFSALPSTDLWCSTIQRVALPDPALPIRTAFSDPDFFETPGLLESSPSLAIEDGHIACDPWRIGDPVIAAAHLLAPRVSNARGSTTTLYTHLRELGRDDLLVHLAPKGRADATRAQEALERARIEQHHLLIAVERESIRLRQIGHPDDPRVSRAIDLAKTLVNTNLPSRSLLTDWLRSLDTFCRKSVDRAIPRLQSQFEALQPVPDDEQRSQFRRALLDGRLDEAVRLAAGEPAAPAPAGERATLWRRTAAETFPAPRRALNDAHGDATELAQAWKAGLLGNAKDDKLCKAFADFVFGTRLGKVAESSKSRELFVNGDTVRRWLQRERLNPSFLPQLTRFSRLSILPAPAPPTSPAFVQKTAEAIVGGRTADTRMTVILAPGLTAGVKETLWGDLRRRSARGCVILDDLDLLRLINPGGQQPNLVIGLLEIMLEQQPKWSPLNPFEPTEGQHAKPEMFVGREDEAKRLATTAQYSRLFSGRKLGKSALLKHIRDTYDEYRLPSHNKLRVVYGHIVGHDSEIKVVELMRGCFREQLGHGHPSKGGSPADELKQLIRSYTDKHERESLLIVLDEADMFVEAQIRDYEQRREACLTWTIRTDLEHQTDSMDLPRVRFVFAGYRTTHRNEGAWANWGDVLRLEPLELEPATRLIAAPLARLGVNADEIAPVAAFQCGYQPAVLVRLGQRLVEHLDSTLTPARRDSPRVNPADVTAVYRDEDVRNEIRTIVWNNFQGNPFGRIIFAATLLEFEQIAPGADLEDAPARVLQRLRAIVPDFLPDSTIEGPAVERVAREMRDFTERSLLRQGEAATRSFQLRFPHQLPILLQGDLESSIRREAPGATLAGEPLDNIRAVLPRVGLENLAEALVTEGISSAVAVSHFIALLAEGAASIPDRLGFGAGERVHALDDVDIVRRFGRSKRLAIMDATPAAAQRVLGARVEAGIHTPPLLMGGLDLLRWAIRSRRDDKLDIELTSVSRLGVTQMRWWFERVRSIEFTGPSPAPEFVKRTSGIPFLVGVLDRVVEARIGFHGVAASPDQVSTALDAYDAAVPPAVRELLKSDPAKMLASREIELLSMVAYASWDAPDRNDLLEILRSPEDWKTILPALANFAGLRPGDETHMEVLLRAGLLPTFPSANPADSLNAFAPVLESDAVFRIVNELARCQAR